MFDLNKLGDMAKIAAEAKNMQDKQDKAQREQTDVLRGISRQLDEVIKLLKEKK